jgi:hypothetical protein
VGLEEDGCGVLREGQDAHLDGKGSNIPCGSPSSVVIEEGIGAQSLVRACARTCTQMNGAVVR